MKPDIVILENANALCEEKHPLMAIQYIQVVNQQNNWAEARRKLTS